MAGTFRFTRNGDYDAAQSADVFAGASPLADDRSPAASFAIDLDDTTDPAFRVHPFSSATSAARPLTDAAGAALRATTGGVFWSASEFTGAVLLTGGLFADTLEGGSSDDTLRGAAGADTLRGGAGDDTLDGGAGADTLDGGDGFDWADYSAAAASVSVDLAYGGRVGDADGDTLLDIEAARGGAGGDSILGNADANTLDGGAGADRLEGRAGADALHGGEGLDTVSYENANGGVRVDLARNTGEGDDADGDRFTSIEALVGSMFADTLIGVAGATASLNGNGAADTLGVAFPSAAPQFFVPGTAYTGGEGFDTVTYAAAPAPVTASLADPARNTGLAAGDAYDGVEALEGGRFADSLEGDGAANTLRGGAGDDLLNGAAGADALLGGEGFDTASFETSNEAVRVALGAFSHGGDAEGDTFEGVERVVGSGLADTLTGATGDETLAGGGGADTLDGAGGFDTADYSRSAAAVAASLAANARNSGGDASGDRLLAIEALAGSLFADTLAGNAEANTLTGNAGDDLLNGAAGADTLLGGSGLDTATYAGAGSAVRVDLARGTASGGDAKGDRLVSVENLVGSAFADTLTALRGATTALSGGAGDDLLAVEAAAPSRLGVAFNGGAGLDTVRYDGALAVSVTLSNGVAAGAARGDTFQAVENLSGGSGNDRLGGDANANTLFGNAGNDTLSGDGGNDRLDGGLGADRLSGGLGNDTYLLDNRSDTILEAANEGTDTLLTSVGYTLRAGVAVEAMTALDTAALNLSGNEFAQTLTGNRFSNTLSGGAGADTLFGGDGNDLLHGGLGADRLSGGLGNDGFLFDSLDASDRVADFGTTPGDDDALRFENAAFTALTKTGRLSASLFAASVTGAARDADDRVLYETDTGKLFYDADGTGAGKATLVALLATRPTLTAGDILVV